MIIDLTRIERTEQKLQDHLNLVRTFHAERVSVLNASRHRIEGFAANFHGQEMSVTNMYSTGISGHNEYADNTDMLATVKFVMTKNYKNLKLLISKMQAHWSADIPNDVRMCRLHEHSFTAIPAGLQVEFQIRISKPN